MKKKFFDSFIAFCLTFALVFTASALPASAAEKVIYAKSLDGKCEYTSIQTAWDAVRNGVTIVMQRDWNLSDRLVLKEDQTGTIYMNGYKINRGLTSSKRDGEVIYLDDDSNLTLKGCNASEENVSNEFEFKGWDLNGTTSTKLTGGGLITGGCSSNGAGGIHMKENANLTLDNIIVAGNKARNDDGGGVNMNNTKGSLTLKNGAAIAYNVALLGGGVYVASNYCNISLSGGSAIKYNSATESGGGIYSYANHTTVTLTEKSSISNNTAKEDGGGYYGFYSFNKIESSDKTGSMSNNVAKDSGGAIFLESVIFGQNENSISGICFEENTCYSRGGAIYLNQEWTTVQDCIIKSNRATGTSGVGGGVYNINDKNTFTNCTITDNYAEGYGGGIFESLYDNIKLKGKVIIKSNTRKGDVADDLYLEDYTYSKAYIVSNPDAGSEIGIKIYADGDERKIGEGTEFDDTLFFSDDKDFYVRYDSTAQEMYLTPKTKVSDFTLTVAKPVAGDPLPTTGTLSWTVDDKASNPLTVPVYWLTQNGEDSAQTASGRADYNTNYSVAAKIDADLFNDVAFADTVNGKVNYIDAEIEDKTYKVYVDDTHSTLYMYGQQVQTGKADIDRVEDARVTITKDSTEDALKALLPKTAVVYDKDGKEYIVNTDLDKADLSAAISGDTVNEDGGSVTIPLKLDGTEKVQNAAGEAEKKLTVTVSVTTNGILEVPKVDVEPGTYKEKDADGKVKLKITLTAEQGAKIYYKVSDAAYEANAANSVKDFKAYDSEAGIVISAAEGTKESVTVRTYAGDKSGYVDSTVAAYTYVLDNPYTVTITKKSTASKDGQGGQQGQDGQAGQVGQDGAEIGDKYTAQYYQGDSVIIGAPVVDEYVFDKWQRQTEAGMTIDDSNEQSDTLMVNGIQNSISLTALYNPVVKPTDTEPDTPTKPSTSHHSSGSKVKDQDQKDDSTTDTTTDQTEAVKAKVAALELMARSSKTSKKNIKVAVKMSTEAQATIDEIQSLGYTVKYKFYRSTKKAAGYKAALTKTSKTYTNTVGKKGTMYYYKARVQVYDADGNLVTQTALKQCKYANRQWGK